MYDVCCNPLINYCHIFFQFEFNQFLAPLLPKHIDTRHIDTRYKDTRYIKIKDGITILPRNSSELFWLKLSKKFFGFKNDV